MMELAGLEPATSCVRFTREASPPFATVRRPCQPWLTDSLGPDSRL